MTTLLNSMGTLTFDVIDQHTLSSVLEKAIFQLTTTVDGVLLLEGGDDIHPSIYDEEVTYAWVSPYSIRRDQRELHLINVAIEQHVPIIALCRGHQLLAASQGGALYQDIECDVGAIHGEYHPVQCLSILRGYRPERMIVNSYHHQAVKRPPKNAIEIARALDGINEGLYYPEINAISVQWHPEFTDDFDLLNWMLGILGKPKMEHLVSQYGELNGVAL